MKRRHLVSQSYVCGAGHRHYVKWADSLELVCAITWFVGENCLSISKAFSVKALRQSKVPEAYVAGVLWSMRRELRHEAALARAKGNSNAMD